MKILYSFMGAIALIFLYFLVTGLYYNYRVNSEQDSCSFGSVSNEDYQQLLNSMTYDLNNLKRDLEIVKHNNSNIRVTLSEIFEKALKKQTSGVDDFHEIVATVHAFMRKIGYSNYVSAKSLWYGHLSDRLIFTYRLEYKMMSSKLSSFDLFGLITRAPSTVFITIETEEFYKNSKYKGVAAYYSHNTHLSSLSHNFNQSSGCPNMLKMNTNNYTYNIKN